MSNSIVAAQMYTVRDSIQTPKDIAESLAKIRSLGYKAVQLSALGPIDTGELKKLLTNEGLITCGNQNGWDDFQNNLQEVIDFHHEMGCKHTCLAMMPLEFNNEQGYHRFAENLNEIGAKLAANDLTFSYHNHSFELQRFGDRTGLQILIEETDPKNVSFEIDTYWIQHGGGDPIDWLEKVKGRMPMVHLKDMTGNGWESLMAEVGEGNMNWEKILPVCKESGAEWYIVEQDNSQRDPFESLGISLRNLKKIGWA